MTKSLSYLLPSVWARLQGYARGWRTTEKIVVIESDDWGAIRVNGQEAFTALEKIGYPMERSCYSFDALETDEDLELFFETLSKIKDTKGRPACVTANMVMANPDFVRIKKENYKTYHYEPVVEAASKSMQRKGVANLWKEGFAKKLFVPQFHAREHVCYWNWLNALNENDEEALNTFKLGMCGLPRVISSKAKSYYTPIYLNSQLLEKHRINVDLMVSRGIELFTTLFGYRPLSTVAPNVTWTHETESIWQANGIRYIQGGFVQNMDTLGRLRYQPRFLGEKNRHQMLYLVRNCNFEPAKEPYNRNCWKKCFQEMKRAFFFQKPAVINTHRVNYSGSIRKSNRQNSLKQLQKLLKAIIQTWPDVCFISSPELGHMIEYRIHKVVPFQRIASKVFPPAK